jgi:hypothetical protein
MEKYKSGSMKATVVAVEKNQIVCIGVLDNRPVTLNIDIDKVMFDISEIVEKEITINFTEDGFVIEKLLD